MFPLCSSTRRSSVRRGMCNIGAPFGTKLENAKIIHPESNNPLTPSIRDKIFQFQNEIVNYNAKENRDGFSKKNLL